MDRKGITPVIAVVLLLMMTVAAAGGAYAWLTQLQNQFQQRAQEDVQRGISLNDLTCYNKGGQAHVVAFFKNSGTTELDLNPVDMNARYAATGNINYSLTTTGMSFTQGRLSQGVVFRTGNSDFSQPRSSAAYRIDLDSQFEIGRRYKMEFVFTDEDGTTKSQTCQAQQR
ncbi:MAG: archaellin/type IV pilin N-terminal domain-containing protein [Candidatus Nanohaloarchaea archaeon]|nr:archaellin/type IV pilin N-terminal domain-containing protein [Candidatus Nanohaloarchaea archaeon]